MSHVGNAREPQQNAWGLLLQVFQLPVCCVCDCVHSLWTAGRGNSWGVALANAQASCEAKVWGMLCVWLQELLHSYSYSFWHGKAVQPTREPEAHRGYAQAARTHCVQWRTHMQGPCCALPGTVQWHTWVSHRVWLRIAVRQGSLTLSALLYQPVHAVVICAGAQHITLHMMCPLLGTLIVKGLDTSWARAPIRHGHFRQGCSVLSF